MEETSQEALLARSRIAGTEPRTVAPGNAHHRFSTAELEQVLGAKAAVVDRPSVAKKPRHQFDQRVVVMQLRQVGKRGESDEEAQSPKKIAPSFTCDTRTGVTSSPSCIERGRSSFSRMIFM